MGLMEEKSKQRTRKHAIQKAILKTVATAGVLSIALAAPNALQTLRSFGFDLRKRRNESVNNSRIRLVQNGLLECNENGLLKLTSKGEAKLRQLELHDYKIKKPKRWDNKWRVLIFDIREERRATRDKIRRTLSVIGFIRLQDSVWVYPHDCEDLITLLKSDFKIGKDVLYIIADTIENDSWLRKQFNLSS